MIIYDPSSYTQCLPCMLKMLTATNYFGISKIGEISPTSFSQKVKSRRQVLKKCVQYELDYPNSSELG